MLTAAQIKDVERLQRHSTPEPNSGCWLWLGAVMKNGYGVTTLAGKHTLAHRASYILARGPIPEGLHLDHLCRVRCCINPDHLEAVTPGENVRRGAPYRFVAACKYGHAMEGDNLIMEKGGRRCRACHHRRQAESYRRRMARLSC